MYTKQLAIENGEHATICGSSCFPASKLYMHLEDLGGLIETVRLDLIAVLRKELETQDAAEVASDLVSRSYATFTEFCDDPCRKFGMPQAPRFEPATDLHGLFADDFHNRFKLLHEMLLEMAEVGGQGDLFSPVVATPRFGNSAKAWSLVEELHEAKLFVRKLAESQTPAAFLGWVQARVELVKPVTVPYEDAFRRFYGSLQVKALVQVLVGKAAAQEEGKGAVPNMPESRFEARKGFALLRS